MAFGEAVAADDSRTRAAPSDRNIAACPADYRPRRPITVEPWQSFLPPVGGVIDRQNPFEILAPLGASRRYSAPQWRG